MDLKTEVQLRQELEDVWLLRNAELTAYNELLMAVGKKHEGETRHQTALRYIREAEQADEWASQPASLAPSSGEP